MAKVLIDAAYLDRLGELDGAVRVLNDRKVALIFEALGMVRNAVDFECMLEWELILVSVPDRQMAVQLNKLSAYVPNLKFKVDTEQPIFTVSPGIKGRRVWKER